MAYANMWGDDDDEIVGAVEQINMEADSDAILAQVDMWDDVYDSDIGGVAEEAELAYAFEVSLDDLTSSVHDDQMDLTSYYEEMGQILAALDPGAAFNPIPAVIQYGGGGGSGDEPIHKDRLFTVLRKSERFYGKFNTQGVYYTLDVSKPNVKMNPEDWLIDLLDSIILYFVSNSPIVIRPSDRVGMTLTNSVCGTEPVYRCHLDVPIK